MLPLGQCLEFGFDALRRLSPPRGGIRQEIQDNAPRTIVPVLIFYGVESCHGRQVWFGREVDLASPVSADLAGNGGQTALFSLIQCYHVRYLGCCLVHHGHGFSFGQLIAMRLDENMWQGLASGGTATIPVT